MNNTWVYEMYKSMQFVYIYFLCYVFCVGVVGCNDESEDPSAVDVQI